MIRKLTVLAINTLVYLSGEAAGRFVLVADIASAIGASRSATHKVLGRLAARGMVISQRGPSGGYTAAPQAAELTLAEVMAAMAEGLDWPGVDAAGSACVPLSDLLGGMRAEALTRLGRITVGALLSRDGNAPPS